MLVNGAVVLAAAASLLFLARLVRSQTRGRADARTRDVRTHLEWTSRMSRVQSLRHPKWAQEQTGPVSMSVFALRTMTARWQVLPRRTGPAGGARGRAAAAPGAAGGCPSLLKNKS